MNKGQIAKYLDNIAAGKLINWPAFVKQLDALNMSEHQLGKILSWKKAKGGKYQVDIIDAEAFLQLRERCHLPAVNNRVTASLSGNSHRKSVSGSLLHLLGAQKALPNTIVIDSNGQFYCDLELHQNLLVVENLENFLALINDRSRADVWLGTAWLETAWLETAWQCDILYAEGNAVSNQLHRSFFSRYTSIQCLLDLDLGGFEIYKNILALSSDSKSKDKQNCTFSLSPYYMEKYHLYGRNISMAEYEKLIKRQYPQALQVAIELVLKHKKFAEQEILLWD